MKPGTPRPPHAVAIRSAAGGALTQWAGPGLQSQAARGPHPAHGPAVGLGPVPSLRWAQFPNLQHEDGSEPSQGD